MSTWFYWQKTITSKWAPVKSDRPPGKSSYGGWRGETKGLVELPADQEDWSLTKLVSFYPLDEPPTAVTVDPAPTPPLAPPAAEAPRRTLQELAEETREAEDKWLMSTITHVKTGAEYLITGIHHRERDMALSVEYSPIGRWQGSVYFSRSVEEMAFGTRFVFTGGPVEVQPDGLMGEQVK